MRVAQILKYFLDHVVVGCFVPFLPRFYISRGTTDAVALWWGCRYVRGMLICVAWPIFNHLHKPVLATQSTLSVQRSLRFNLPLNHLSNQVRSLHSSSSLIVAKCSTVFAVPAHNLQPSCNPVLSLPFSWLYSINPNTQLPVPSSKCSAFVPVSAQPSAKPAVQPAIQSFTQSSV